MATVYLVQEPDGAVRPEAYGTLEQAIVSRGFVGQPHEPVPYNGGARIGMGNGYNILAHEVEFEDAE